jgi:hypothetical protein
MSVSVETRAICGGHLLSGAGEISATLATATFEPGKAGIQF